VGIAPTPTLSFLARTGDFSLGAIVSASHNPAPDNGVKFVGHDGRKLSDEAEAEIESEMDGQFERPLGAYVGDIQVDRSGIARYQEMLVELVPERLDGWRVAMDCAHGAAFELGPQVLRELGADVILTGASPDGVNINAEGGATKPDTVSRLTVDRQCGIGVAFDGDADRCIFCDEHGRLINGDRAMGVWALDKQSRGELNPKKAVGTVMSNGGFEAHLADHGVELVRAPVGDKYVAQKIEESGALVGGEQSGHIIFPHRGPTGDGLITMLELFRVLRRQGVTLASHYESYTPWPQLLVNVGVSSTTDWQILLTEELQMGHALLGKQGRMVVRASGTQPMIRVMVEADGEELRDIVAEKIVSALTAKLGGTVLGRVDLTYALGD
jgi:phosphoglucosamine mutase